MNKNDFKNTLEQQYIELFANDADYSYSASHTTPNALAEKMTAGLLTGSANKDGKAIKKACQFYKIPYTYKAIKEFLNS